MKKQNVNSRVVPARYICQELDCATPRILTKQKSQEQLTTCLELLLTSQKKCHHKWIQTLKQKPNIVTLSWCYTIHNHSETIQHIFEGKTGGTLGDTLRASNPACDKHRNTLNSGLHFHASLCKCLLHFCKGRSGETHPHHSPSAVRRDTRWH